MFLTIPFLGSLTYRRQSPYMVHSKFKQLQEFLVCPDLLSPERVNWSVFRTENGLAQFLNAVCYIIYERPI